MQLIEPILQSTVDDILTYILYSGRLFKVQDTWLVDKCDDENESEEDDEDSEHNQDRSHNADGGFTDVIVVDGRLSWWVSKHMPI